MTQIAFCLITARKCPALIKANPTKVKYSLILVDKCQLITCLLKCYNFSKLTFFFLTATFPGLDLMSLTTPGLLWVGEICTDLAMVIMSPNKAASEVVMVVDLTATTGIALTLSEVETRAGLAGKHLTHAQN